MSGKHIEIVLCGVGWGGGGGEGVCVGAGGGVQLRKGMLS